MLELIIVFNINILIEYLESESRVLESFYEEIRARFRLFDGFAGRRGERLDRTRFQTYHEGRFLKDDCHA